MRNCSSVSSVSTGIYILHLEDGDATSKSHKDAQHASGGVLEMLMNAEKPIIKK